MKLKYPKKLIESATNSAQHPGDLNRTPTDSPPRIALPCKDQNFGDSCATLDARSIVLCSQSSSKKIIDDLRETELKPTLVNQQIVVYEFKCDLCDANYIGYTNIPLLASISWKNTTLNR